MLNILADFTLHIVFDFELKMSSICMKINFAVHEHILHFINYLVLHSQSLSTNL